MRVLACVVLLVAPVTAPDSWIPFADKRLVARNGRDYLLIEKQPDARSARFTIARAAEGAPYVTAVESGVGARGLKGEVKVRAGDRVVARGVLPHLPLNVMLSERRDGFVTVDTYYSCGEGKVLNCVSQKGELRVSKTLDELFGKDEREGFWASVSSYHWLSECWLDEAQGLVFLVANSDLIKVVGVRDGKVAYADRKVVLRALEGPGKPDRAALLGHALLRGVALPPDLLHRLMADASLSEPVRIRAATGLAAQGVVAGREFVLRRMFVDKPVENGRDQEIDGRIWRWVGLAFGDAAVGLMRRLHGHRAPDAATVAGRLGVPQAATWLSARPRVPAEARLPYGREKPEFAELLHMGAAGRAYLLELLDSGSETLVTGALFALATSGEAQFAGRICEVVLAHPAHLDSVYGLGGYLSGCGARIAPQMSRLLRACGPSVAGVYAWFASNRIADPRPLIERLARQRGEIFAMTEDRDLLALRERLHDLGEVGYATGQLLDALKFQTGEDHGLDVAAWRALAERRK